MKATINGIVIEGTAQEVADVIRLVSADKNVSTPRNNAVVIPRKTYSYTDARAIIQPVDNAVNPYTMT